MSGDEDDYGRRRSEEHLYATVGNGPAPAKPASAIAQVLEGLKFPQREIAETETAIVTMMGRMKEDTPVSQQRMVQTFLGSRATPDAVEQVTDLALKRVTPQKVDFDSGYRKPLFETVPTISPPGMKK